MPDDYTPQPIATEPEYRTSSTSATYEPKIMYDLKEPATIGDLKIDVIIDRETTFDSEVTEHPVEDGFSIADHVVRKPIALTMNVLFTPTPVTWSELLGVSQNRMMEVVNSLQEIYRKGEPVTVTTVDAIYPDMMMTHAPLPRNVENGYCYSMQIDFVQIRRAKAKTEALPEGNTAETAEGKAGETEKDAGQASQEEIGTGVTMIENDAVIEVDTTRIGKGQTGDIATGKEQEANSAARALWECLGMRVASAILSEMG